MSNKEATDQSPIVDLNCFDDLGEFQREINLSNDVVAELRKNGTEVIAETKVADFTDCPHVEAMREAMKKTTFEKRDEPRSFEYKTASGAKDKRYYRPDLEAYQLHSVFVKLLDKMRNVD